ncbi:hypothetical protein [Nonomuraea sp. NPDC002799]
MQEAFVRAERTYDPARGPRRPWLFHLATKFRFSAPMSFEPARRTER